MQGSVCFRRASVCDTLSVMHPNHGALATLDIDAALAEISTGVLMRDLAARYGVRKQSLRERLMKHPEYAAAINQQAESIVEQAVAEMMDENLPADVPVITRARARVDTAFKWAAARDPARWGNKAGVTVNIAAVNLAPDVGNKLADILNTVSIQQQSSAALGQLPFVSDDESEKH